MSADAIRHQGKWTDGGKGYPKGPVPIFPKCLHMGTGANGHLGQIDVWGKGYPKCPMPISPNVCTFGGKGYSKCPKEVSPNALHPIPPNVYK